MTDSICLNDYHQSSEKILAELEVQISNLLFSSLLCYRLTYGGLAALNRMACKTVVGKEENVNNKYFLLFKECFYPIYHRPYNNL